MLAAQSPPPNTAVPSARRTGTPLGGSFALGSNICRVQPISIRNRGRIQAAAQKEIGADDFPVIPLVAASSYRHIVVSRATAWPQC